MPFTPTTWVDGSAPGITAAQLNRIETGVADAHAGVRDAGALETAGIYVGRLSSAAPDAADELPSGWSVARGTAGAFIVTHNLGHTTYDVVATADYGVRSTEYMVSARLIMRSTNTFEVFTVRWNHLAVNNITRNEGPGFSFVLVDRS